MTYLLLPFSLLALGCVVPGQPFSTRFWVGSGVQGATGEGTFLGGPASSSRMRPGLGLGLNRCLYPVCPSLPLSSQVSK